MGLIVGKKPQSCDRLSICYVLAHEDVGEADLNPMSWRGIFLSQVVRKFLYFNIVAGPQALVESVVSKTHGAG